jgi:protein-tyrosine-phosphatase
MDLETRARRHAALGDPVRLAIVDDLATSDRSPGELAERHELASNLLAHHLGVLEDVGLIARSASAGDGRRRYVRLRHEGLAAGLGPLPAAIGAPVVFVCTHNSARSQLAAALWSRTIGVAASSAGTDPAKGVHPGAIAAAERAGLDLSGATPRHFVDVDVDRARVITVCDRAHEELTPDPTWWHWSIPDPIEDHAAEAFDRTVDRLRRRIETIEEGARRCASRS